MRKKITKMLNSNFALLTVIFKWHHGSEGVKKHTKIRVYRCHSWGSARSFLRHSAQFHGTPTKWETFISLTLPAPDALPDRTETDEGPQGMRPVLYWNNLGSWVITAVFYSLCGSKLLRKWTCSVNFVCLVVLFLCVSLLYSWIWKDLP